MSTLGRILSRNNAQTADVQWATYVRPVGRRGKHLVKLICSEKEVAVSGPPDYTLRPGTTVALSSHQNSQSKVMHAFPPAAGRGSSAYSADMFHAIKAAPQTCPVNQSGKSYIGLYLDGSDLYSYEYADGTLGDAGPVGDLSAAGTFVSISTPFPHPATSTIYARLSPVGGDVFVGFDYATGAVDYYDTTIASPNVAGPVVIGSTVYTCELDGTDLKLVTYSLALGSRSEVGTPQTIVNPGGIVALAVRSATAIDLYLDEDGDTNCYTHDGIGWTLDNTRPLALGYSFPAVGVPDASSSYIGGETGFGKITSGVGEVSQVPAHWVGDSLYVCIINGAIFWTSGEDFTRLALADYSATSADCSQPTTAIAQIPAHAAYPHALVPIT